MYAYIKGKADSYADGNLVVEAGGIGYSVCVSSFTAGECFKPGETIKLYLYLSMREDEMSLFGFATPEEKKMFMRLITVSGVGPKMAIGILSAAPLSSLAAAIVSGDTKALSKVKGIGKKTAERIIVELKESMGDDGLRMAFSDTPLGASSEKDPMVDEAVEVLTTLGVSRSEAYAMAAAERKAVGSVNELVMNVLRRLDK